jgi:UbiD family decarboxylase
MRHYMQTLRERGEILDVHREVDPKHELAAVTQAAMRRWNKPILFHRVAGTTLPVLTNLYGSRERLADIIGIAPDDFCRQWTNLTGLGGAVAGPLKLEVPVAPELIECRLSDLPLLTYSERDGGPYFTSAMFVAKEPETGVPNLSFHRSMYISDEELRCRLAPRHHLTLYHEKAERMGRPLEAAMLIGPPPTVFLAAAAPVPYDVDELGEFMGYYVPVGPQAVFEVLGITRRPDAVFHSILCGSSEEVLSLELSVAANIYQRISAVLPGIVDVTCQPFVLHTVVKIRQQYEGQRARC